MAKKKNVVKSTQGTLRLIFAGVLVISWLITVLMVTNNDEEKAQMELVQSADLLLEDKLYVRAAGRYKTAITEYSTDKNQELEAKLLSIYKEGGLTEEYRDLIKTRMSAGRATAAEYVDYASDLIKGGSAANAAAILAEGENLFDDEGLTELYESIKYQNTAREIGFTEVKMPSSDWIIPAFDGEKWGYINEGGAVELDFIYEDATRFSGQYAVVKINGVYTLIDRAGNWIAVDKSGLEQVTALSGNKIIAIKDKVHYIYSYTFDVLSSEGYEEAYLNDNGLIVVKKNGKWMILSSELEPVTEEVYEDVVVNNRGQVFSENYAMVKDIDGYFLINMSGEACFETRFSDAKGFEGGLIAVADSSDRWGFINGNGEYIIECQYEDAYSFSHHLAAVKYAGKWGYINRYNHMMIENQYEKATPFLEGKSFVTDSMGTQRIVSLKYHELFN